MKIDNDCIRDVLLHLEAELAIDIEGDICTFRPIALVDLFEKDALSDYSKESVFYAVYNLNQCGFIESRYINTAEFNNVGDGWIECMILNISFEGHKFLDAIRPQSIWTKTKGVLSKIGNHSLTFIEQTAQMIALEMIKSAVIG